MMRRNTAEDMPAGTRDAILFLRFSAPTHAFPLAPSLDEQF